MTTLTLYTKEKDKVGTPKLYCYSKSRLKSVTIELLPPNFKSSSSVRSLSLEYKTSPYPAMTLSSHTVRCFGAIVKCKPASRQTRAYTVNY